MRTIEHWADNGKLPPADCVYGRLLVFRREEIVALARDYREYVALSNRINSGTANRDAILRIEA